MANFKIDHFVFGAKTLIAITHRNTLMRLVSRVMVIDKGILVADDTPEKFMTSKPS